MRIEAARAGVHGAVHPGQLDEATERDGADGVEGLASLPAEELRNESEAELLHLDAGELGADEVARLVHDHEDAEDEDDERDEYDGAHAGSWLHSRLGPVAAARTWARAQRSAAMTASSVNSCAGSAASTARATEGMMSMNRRWPWRKRATASSLAAFSTAGVVPPRCPASRASATAGERTASSASNESCQSVARSGAGATPSNRSGKLRAIAIGRCMSGTPSCALMLPSTNSTIE